MLETSQINGFEGEKTILVLFLRKTILKSFKNRPKVFVYHSSVKADIEISDPDWVVALIETTMMKSKGPENLESFSSPTQLLIL